MTTKKIDRTGIILLSTSACFMFFLYAPISLYFANKSEFFYDIYIMLPPLMCMFFIMTVLSIAFLLLFNKTRIYPVVICFYFIAFLCSYIQGNYMVGWLPHIKGARINWNDYMGQRIVCIIMWIVVTALVILLYRNKVYFLKTVIYVSGGIGLVLLVTLLISGFTSGGFERKTIHSSTSTSKNILSYSEKRNFLILLLDKVDAQTVREVFAEDEEYASVFRDFTFFTNAEAAYPYTEHSIPMILSGVRYEKQSDYDDYLMNAYAGSELFRMLEEKDYSMGIYETIFEYSADDYHRFDNLVDCQRKISSWITFCRWQTLLTGYRYAPFDLKRFCYVYTNAFNTLKVLPDGEELFDDNNTYFWSLLNESTQTPVIENNNFRYIHVQGAHELLYDSQMNSIDNGSYEDAVKASLLIAKQYLEIYRELGAYDNSCIIIMADHGALNEKQDNPMLLIKGIDEKHDLKYDDAPISFDDLMEAYTRLLDGKSSDEVFDWHEGDVRDRRLLFQDDDDNPEMIMEEYIQHGHAGNQVTLEKIKEF